MNTSNFKVIVVGGGPVGLTAAHALTHAGIDFTVLERRDTPIVDAGSNLVLKQQGLRALSQLGMLDALEEVSSELKDLNRIDYNGRDLGNLEFFRFAKEYFGVFPRVLSRYDLNKVLYNNLAPESQAKIVCNAKVVEVQSTADDVRVICEDGSLHAGSLVIAADGAHSVVRESMRKLALEAGSEQLNEEEPFLTTYRCLWVRFSTLSLPELLPGFTCETHGYGASTQLFIGETSGVTGIYERLNEPTRDRLRYNQDDQDALIERWGFLPLTKDRKITLRSAYENRLQSGLVSLEEGVVQHWSWDGQVVLTGDAAHKFTPSTGAGCNSGITDVVALVNELHKLVSGTANNKPSRAEVAAALQAYQATRYDSVVSGCQAASDATAASTWATGFLRLMDCYLLPLSLLQKQMFKQLALTVARMPVFTFIKGEERLNGKMPWVHPIKT
ncbi:FAD-dependent monooxygenase sdnN [Paramyrothecium foliicola]|nr:FAD-dependent monooxygenase sdnN [Paramyrothecium foliicola]